MVLDQWNLYASLIILSEVAFMARLVIGNTMDIKNKWKKTLLQLMNEIALNAKYPIQKYLL